MYRMDAHLDSQICHISYSHRPLYRLKMDENRGLGSRIYPLIVRFWRLVFCVNCWYHVFCGKNEEKKVCER